MSYPASEYTSSPICVPIAYGSLLAFHEFTLRYRHLSYADLKNEKPHIITGPYIHMFFACLHY